MIFEDPKDETPTADAVENFLKERYKADISSQGQKGQLKDEADKINRAESNGNTEIERSENLKIFKKLEEIIHRYGQNGVSTEGGQVAFTRQDKLKIEDRFGNDFSERTDRYYIGVSFIKSKLDTKDLEMIIETYAIGPLPENIAYPFYFISAQRDTYDMTSSPCGPLPSEFIAKNGDIFTSRNGYFFDEKGVSYKIEKVSNITQKFKEMGDDVVTGGGYTPELYPKLDIAPNSVARFTSLDPGDYEKIGRAIQQINSGNVLFGRSTPISDII